MMSLVESECRQPWMPVTRIVEPATCYRNHYIPCHNINMDGKRGSHSKMKRDIKRRRTGKKHRADMGWESNLRVHFHHNP